MNPSFLPLLIRCGLLVTRLSDAKGSLGQQARQGRWPSPPQHLSPDWDDFFLFVFRQEGWRGRRTSLGDFFKNDFSCWQKRRKSFQRENWPFACHGTGYQWGLSNSSLMRKDFVFAPRQCSQRIALFSWWSAGKLPPLRISWAPLANSTSHCMPAYRTFCPGAIWSLQHFFSRWPWQPPQLAVNSWRSRSSDQTPKPLGKFDLPLIFPKRTALFLQERQRHHHDGLFPAQNHRII